MFGIRKTRKSTKSDLIPKGIATTVIPSVFIDGNKNPIWDNNHSLLRNSKKSIIDIKKS